MSNYEPILYMTYPQIAEMESKAAIAEQERIIKLLEDFNEYNPTCQCCYTELCINDVIALIKGEQK